jgi:hypothetical protein
VAVTVVVPELTQSNLVTPEPPEESQKAEYISTAGYPRLPAWIIAMLFITLCVGLGYFAGLRLENRRSALRWALGITIGGLAAYNYLAFGLFGIFGWLASSGLGGLLAFVFAGELLGFAGGWAWSKR